MNFLTLLAILIIGVVGARSAVIKSDQLTVIQNHGFARNDLDFIIGEVTANSVLVFSERKTVNDVFTWFEYVHSSPLKITRIEVLNLSNGTGAETFLALGGLGFRHATIDLYKNDNMPGIDVNVYIYGEPMANNDFVYGELTDTLFLLNSQRITGERFIFFEWDGYLPIIRLEAIDQTNGDGGFLWAYHFFNDNRVAYLYFFADIAQPIDFIINLYREPLPPNDLILGEVTEDSIVVFNNRITEQQSNTFRFTWEGPYPLVRIEFLDQTAGTSDVTFIQGGLNETKLEALLSRVNHGTKIDFNIILYVDPRRPEHE